jgi:cytoskeletal protein CcmA (bactofilin family)
VTDGIKRAAASEEGPYMLKKTPGVAAEHAEITAFLGKGTEFKGVLSFGGTIRVDGKVDGEVVSKDTLICGDEAFLQGEIGVGTLILSGKIVGNVSASEKVHLLAPAVVEGNIRTPKLIIEEGVTFDGKCEMANQKKSADQKAVSPGDKQ